MLATQEESLCFTQCNTPILHMIQEKIPKYTLKFPMNRYLHLEFNYRDSGKIRTFNDNVYNNLQ